MDFGNTGVARRSAGPGSPAKQLMLGAYPAGKLESALLYGSGTLYPEYSSGAIGLVSSSSEEDFMASCDKLGDCAFFSGHVAYMPAVANLLKEKYCFEDSKQCARLQLSSAGKAVPDDLYPNDSERAEELLHS